MTFFELLTADPMNKVAISIRISLGLYALSLLTCAMLSNVPFVPGISESVNATISIKTVSVLPRVQWHTFQYFKA